MECGQSTSHLISPLQIEWDPGTEKIGDFSWGGYTCVVTEGASQKLLIEGFEIELENTIVNKPQKKTNYPRLGFPYSGPKLLWLIPKKRVPLNPDLNGCPLDP